MIKIENVDVYGWETAIRGMRNPMNSWNNSDSEFGVSELTGKITVNIGNNDIELMRKLSAAGTDHAKYLRMINVTLDIVAPLYWWKEYDTYKVGTVANSCSTMHKIHDKEFTLEDFSHEHLYRVVDNTGIRWDCLGSLEHTIQHLNAAREAYLNSKDKDIWYQMIQLLPSSYNQKRTVQLNYQVLKNMYHARKNHKLDEWRDYCKWIESLPHSELITGVGKDAE